MSERRQTFWSSLFFHLLTFRLKIKTGRFYPRFMLKYSYVQLEYECFGFQKPGGIYYLET